MQHLQKTAGYLLQPKYFSLSSPRRLFLSLPPILRTLFQVPYPVSPLRATLTKTPGVWGYSSHFGTCRLRECPPFPTTFTTFLPSSPTAQILQFPKSKNCPILRNFS